MGMSELAAGSAPDSLVIVYDSCNVDAIPDDAQVLMGYVDVYDASGRSIYDLMKARFPNATVISGTVTGVPGVRWCDMETGDLSAPEAATWAYNEIQSGRPVWDPPTIYCQAANGESVKVALADLGLTMGSQVPWAMAWWNDVQDLNPPPPPWPILPPPVCHQFMTIKNTYDMSVALSSWIWPAPPAPPPKPKETQIMFLRNPGPAAVGPVAEGGICLCSPAGAVNLGNSWPTIVAAYESANVPLILINDAALLEKFVAISYH